MTVVKRMTATPDFLKMPMTDRDCTVEEYETCRTRKLLEKCDCVPVEVPGYQVGNFGQTNVNLKFFRAKTPATIRAGVYIVYIMLWVCTRCLMMLYLSNIFREQGRNLHWTCNQAWISWRRATYTSLMSLWHFYIYVPIRRD